MNTVGIILICLVSSLQAYPHPHPDSPGPLPIPRPGADGSYGGDQFFQYINVPASKVFEWGYRRGSASHNREEYLSQKDHTFKAKVKWEDTYGGHGEHYYDINHADAGYAPAPAPYSPPAPAYSPHHFEQDHDLRHPTVISSERLTEQETSKLKPVTVNDVR